MNMNKVLEVLQDPEGNPTQLFERFDPGVTENQQMVNVAFASQAQVVLIYKLQKSIIRSHNQSVCYLRQSLSRGE